MTRVPADKSRNASNRTFKYSNRAVRSLSNYGRFFGEFLEGIIGKILNMPNTD